MSNSFNEDTRVKIPAILHLTQLGYKYLSLKEAVWDVETNIFINIFKSSISRINPDLTDIEIDRLYQDLSLDLENEDLGKAFLKNSLIVTEIDLLISTILKIMIFMS